MLWHSQSKSTFAGSSVPICWLSPNFYRFFSPLNISQTQYQKKLISLFEMGQGSGPKIVRGLCQWHSPDTVWNFGVMQPNKVQAKDEIFTVSCLKMPNVFMTKKSTLLILVLIQKLLILQLLHCPLRGRHSLSSHYRAWKSLIKCWMLLNKISYRSKCQPTHHNQFCFSFSSLACHTTITLQKSHLHGERGISKKYFIKLRTKYHYLAEREIQVG